MVDVVLAEKKLRVPIRLEERVRAHAVLVDFVFVGINQTAVGIMLDRQHDEGERMLRESVILVEERTPISGCQFQGGIRTSGDVTIMFTEPQLYPRVRSRDPFEERSDFRIGGSVIGNAKLPAFVNLLPDRIDRGLEQPKVRIVNRQDNGNRRVAWQKAKFAPQRYGGCGPHRIKLRDPILIDVAVS